MGSEHAWGQPLATIQQLIEAGILSANETGARTLYRSTDQPEDNELQKRLADARELLARSEHKRHLQNVLIEGGFAAEALAPVRDAVETGLQALVIWQGHDSEAPPEPGLIDSVLVRTDLLPAETLSLVTHLREYPSAEGETQEAELIVQSERLLSQAVLLLGPSKNL